jgi:hypothetical protein
VRVIDERPARTVAAVAVLAVVTWTLAHAPGLSILEAPALALRLAATLAIAVHLVLAAARAGGMRAGSRRSTVLVYIE